MYVLSATFASIVHFCLAASFHRSMGNSTFKSIQFTWEAACPEGLPWGDQCGDLDSGNELPRFQGVLHSACRMI